MLKRTAFTGRALFRLLDQNVLYPLLRNSDFAERFKGSLVEKYGNILFHEDAILATNSTIFELLGIIPRYPSVAQKPTLNGKRPDEIVREISNFANQFYKAESERLTLELRNACMYQRGQCGSDKVGIFDAVTHRIHKVDFEDRLRFSLLFDFVSKYSFPKSLEDGVLNFLADQCIFKSLEVGRNQSCFRIIKRVWQTSFSHYCSESVSEEIRKDVAECNKLMKLKTKKDFVDCDIAHFSVFGWALSPPSNFTRVHCFTMDPEETVRFRIRILKGVVESRRKFLNRESGSDFPENLVSSKNGLVTFVEKNGTIVKTIDVGRECPPIEIVR